MIELRNVDFGYRDKPALFRGLNWCVKPGEQWSVVGPSGCGKTSLLMLLAGLQKPQEGEVLRAGDVLTEPSAESGVVFQGAELLPWATLRRNVELGLRVARFNRRWGRGGTSVSRAAVRERASVWLDRLGLTDVAEQLPAEASGGQRQRAAIARTLAMDAKRLLMDEPFAAVDAPRREALRSDILELSAARGLSLVLVTHSIEEAVLMGQRILVLRPGETTEAHVVENQHSRRATPEESAEWRERCRRVRAML